MADERQLRCLIAAGGTVGHVAPALAVAEALQRRGVLVTFAGSPDRVEARLVPERGYAFDAFSVSGLPRRPGSRSPAPRGRRSRRRPPACASCGAGPTSCSAPAATSPGRWCSQRGSRGIPCALTEADAHLASRTGSPRRSPIASSSRSRRPRRGEVPRSRPADPRDLAAPLARRGARALGLSPDARVVLVFGGSLGARLLNDVALDAWAEAGRPSSTSAASATTRSCADRVAPRLHPRPFIEEIGSRTAPPTSCSRARAGRSGSSPRPACRRCSFPASSRRARTRRRTPAGSLTPAARWSCRRRMRRGAARRSRICSPTRPARGMAAAMRAAAKPDAAEEIADELVGLARR